MMAIFAPPRSFWRTKGEDEAAEIAPREGGSDEDVGEGAGLLQLPEVSSPATVWWRRTWLKTLPGA